MSPAEDRGFLAQQTVEPPRSHSLQRLLQELAACGDTTAVALPLLELDDFAVLARTDADPTPLPGERFRLLELLETLHAEVRQRLY